MLIRDTNTNDIENCLNLDNENYWTKRDFSESIKNKMAIFLVAEDNDIIMGFVIGFIVPTKFYEAIIHETRVDENFRGKRIGTKLVNEFCAQAEEKGVKTVYAMIESALKPFYLDACGFSETGKWVEASKNLQ